LTDNTAGNILEDREGNIWVSSIKGLDRFSRRQLVAVGLPPTYVRFTLLAGAGGDVWVGSPDETPLLRISGEKIIEQRLPMAVSSVYRDDGGTVWWGREGRIWKQPKDRFESFARPTSANDWFWEIFPSGEPGAVPESARERRRLLKPPRRLPDPAGFRSARQGLYALKDDRRHT